MLLNIGQEFIDLFTTDMHWVVLLLIFLGIIFCIIEAVIPGFGIFGIMGILCEVGALVTHAILFKSVFQVFVLLIMQTIVILAIFLIFVRSAQHGLLGKTPIVENGTAIPKDYREQAEKALKELIGKEGLVLAECRPCGKIRIDQQIFEVQANGTYIQKGEVVKVIKIENANIIVDKLSY